MADEKSYRTAIGFVFAPEGSGWTKEVTTAAGVKTVTEFMLSAVGLNGDVVIRLSFWDAVPEFVRVGAGVMVSGKFDTFAGQDKEGNEKITKTISVNKILPLGENALVRGGGGAPQKPPKKVGAKAVEADLDDDLGF